MAAEPISITAIRVPSEISFSGQDFQPAPQIQDLAESLITRYPELANLEEARITYLWAREGGKTRGRSTLGKCIKASGLPKYFTEADYIIWLAADHCRAFGLSQQQIEALTFHELLHAQLDDSGEDPAWKVRPHDVEMFNEELLRYGAWTSELKSAKDAFEQSPLPLTVAPFGGAA